MEVEISKWGLLRPVALGLSTVNLLTQIPFDVTGSLFADSSLDLIKPLLMQRSACPVRYGFKAPPLVNFYNPIADVHHLEG